MKDPNAWVYLIRAMEDAWSAEKKRKGRRRTDANTELVEESAPPSDRGPVRSTLDREGAQLARDELLARLEGSPLALKVVRLCIEEGEMTPAEIAERLGEKVTRIYECQRRISQEVDRIVTATRRKDEREDGGE
jgi:DNA-directed RNA polymerase specialized sigma24 family protein